MDSSGTPGKKDESGAGLWLSLTSEVLAGALTSAHPMVMGTTALHGDGREKTLAKVLQL